MTVSSVASRSYLTDTSRRYSDRGYLVVVSELVEAVHHFLFGIAIDEGFKGPQANTLAWDVLYLSVSVLVCLLAAILVFALKLYKRVVYRLALYQVMAALAIALVELSQIFMVSYRNEDFPPLYAERACVAIACLGLYTLWVKLFFTTWVSFHLFCLAVLGKNMKKLELLYVVTSLLVPFTIAVVPLITHSYGFSKIDGCSIPAYSANNTLWLRIAAIERFSLLEGPAQCILLASSSAMIVMVIKLGHNFCRRRKYEKYEEISDHYLPFHYCSSSS
eukprot:Em0007g421a